MLVYDETGCPMTMEMDLYVSPGSSTVDGDSLPLGNGPLQAVRESRRLDALDALDARVQR